MKIILVSVSVFCLIMVAFMFRAIDEDARFAQQIAASVASRQTVQQTQAQPEPTGEPLQAVSSVSTEPVAFSFCGGFEYTFLCKASEKFNGLMATRGVKTFASNYESSSSSDSLTRNIIGYVGSHETVYLYFAAHGYNNYNGGLCLPCVDESQPAENSISYADIGRVIDALERSGAKHVVVIIDSCYAGIALPALAKPGREIILSSEPYEASYASTDGNLFTSAWVDCMSGVWDTRYCVGEAEKTLTKQSPVYWKEQE